ncbi:MAG: hypothetical protein QE284_06900 [Rhizobium sp.]|nr:hypothetical protein [Rhizobium sp.]
MLDKFTEEISHFIGALHASLEHARAREAYSEFAFQKVEATVDELPVHTGDFAAPFALLGFEPDIGYRSPVPGHPELATKSPDVPVLTAARTVGYHVEVNIDTPFPGGTGSSSTLGRSFTAEIEAPGSVVNYISQAISLSDDDVFSIGGHGLRFQPDPIDDAELLDAAESVSALSPLPEITRPGSGEEVLQVIKMIMEEAGEVSEDGDSDAVQIHISASSIDGIYVNGQLVDVAPEIEDHHAFSQAKDEDGNDEATSNVLISEDGVLAVDVSVEVHTGGNTLVNDVVLQNFWTGATITLVAGDHLDLNAIVQTNALWDEDAITSAITPSSAEAAANELFNIATFDHLEASTGGAPDAGESAVYPSFWAVTEIKGDLMIVNWLEQIIFMSDDDVGILSSSGVTTRVTAGDNFSVNDVSLFELGFRYDLIIVGGSVFDANIIHQMNVLFDNDVVGAVGNFQTAGEGSVSSSGNLLWNQARIGTVGDADRFEALSQDQVETIASCRDGDATISSDLLSDPAFAGLQALRVLYISGDLINLQYIRQTNILGDSDQIALAMDAIAPNLDADWTIETGSNALLNSATIIDLDSVGKTYVGGQQYSQETLFQAELISSQPDFGNPNADALVSEAVLFLDDSMLGSEDHSAASDTFCLPSDYESHAGDGVNSIIGH